MFVKHRRYRHFYRHVLLLCCFAALLISCASPTSAVVPAAPLVKGETFYIYRGLLNAVTAVAWSPDGTRIAAASYDRTVQVWDAATGQAHADVPGTHGHGCGAGMVARRNTDRFREL
jgi:WD40 repeat protein